jgi:hypothetical protein
MTAGADRNTTSTTCTSSGVLVTAAMPTITLDSPRLLASLREYLTTRNDVVAIAPAANTLEVTILGSYSSASLRDELARRTDGWAHARKAEGIDVSLAFDTQESQPLPLAASWVERRLRSPLRSAQ